MPFSGTAIAPTVLGGAVNVVNGSWNSTPGLVKFYLLGSPGIAPVNASVNVLAPTWYTVTNDGGTDGTMCDGHNAFGTGGAFGLWPTTAWTSTQTASATTISITSLADVTRLYVNASNVGGWVVQSAGWALAQAPLPPAFDAKVIRRADGLLRSLLSARQRRTWERFRYFIVESPNRPGVVYKVPDRGMITMLEHGRPVKKLCIHPADDLPVGDVMASFKLLIEAEEEELHRMANVHRIPALVG